MRYRLGLDTNVLYSGIFYGGPPAEIMDLIEEDDADLVFHEFARDELRGVLHRHRRSEIPLEDLLVLENVRLVFDADYATPGNLSEAKTLCRDAKDVPHLAFALNALRHNVIDYFITGDSDLLTPAIRKASKNRVVTPAEFLKLE